MKALLALWGGVLVVQASTASGLPDFTAHPQTQLHAPGSSFTLSCTATNADSFQWRHNGADLPGATNATLSFTNAQSTNTGYYVVIAKNSAGWAPSQMAYLNVTSGGGWVPFSNYYLTNETYWTPVRYPWGAYGAGPLGSPVTSGIARVMAGPELDQMSEVVLGSGSWPFGPFDYWDFSWGWAEAGYFDGTELELTNVGPDQLVYYRVQITYPNNSYVHPSTTLKLITGGGTNPIPSLEGLKFPGWIEWPDPAVVSTYATPTNQLRIAGEVVNITLYFLGYYDFGLPQIQWRKDGKAIPGATNISVEPPHSGYYSASPSLTLSNIQAADAGVYDMMVFANNWLASPRVTVGVQTENGEGIFKSPRESESQFQADFVGAAGRDYLVECSSNLVNWTDLLTLTNTTGTLVFSNSIPPEGNLFYRSRLLP